MCAWGKRLRTLVAQSQDRASVLCNLGILKMRNAISRLRKFSDYSDYTKHINVHYLEYGRYHNHNMRRTFS